MSLLGELLAGIKYKAGRQFRYHLILNKFAKKHNASVKHKQQHKHTLRSDRNDRGHGL